MNEFIIENLTTVESLKVHLSKEKQIQEYDDIYSTSFNFERKIKLLIYSLIHRKEIYNLETENTIKFNNLLYFLLGDGAQIINDVYSYVKFIYTLLSITSGSNYQFKNNRLCLTTRGNRILAIDDILYKIIKKSSRIYVIFESALNIQDIMSGYFSHSETRYFVQASLTNIGLYAHGNYYAGSSHEFLFHDLVHSERVYEALKRVDTLKIKFMYRKNDRYMNMILFMWIFEEYLGTQTFSSNTSGVNTVESLKQNIKFEKMLKNPCEYINRNTYYEPKDVYYILMWCIKDKQLNEIQQLKLNKIKGILSGKIKSYCELGLLLGFISTVYQ